MLEVRGVRAGAGVDHRVVADLLERRVVPAAPQLVADVVVRRGRDPDRPRARRRVLEIDEDLLPVRLVVVRAVERGAVVVHEVEVQVLEHDPAVPRGRPGRGRRSADRPRGHAAYLTCAARGGAARDRAAQQQRGSEAGVDQPREQSDAGQPTGRAEDLPVGSVAPARELERAMGRWTRRRYRVSPGGAMAVASRSGVSSPGRDDDLPIAFGRPDEQIAFPQVTVDVRREEQLTVVVTDDRLVRAEELEVRGRDVFLDRDGHIPNRLALGPRKTSRTGR